MRREWLSLIFGAVLVLLTVNVLVEPSGPSDLLALQRHRAELEARQANLAAENATFRTNVQKLRSDDRYLQTLIRRELGYARPDELVYKFTGNRDSSSR
ncbi:MAG: septum formation initiator family protein [Candidatus Binatus sp.]|uniref:FtsB family cell division protein n=1 Tax=Candidatus Binatus sp. TaxID=2811406 RepID=UPI0027228CA8|nr:septum formation initiator family protein [Candidatus Binatus sp.]MDO8431971.1 septum formation initiator family protein [Candidatus Binatus sp.]